MSNGKDRPPALASAVEQAGPRPFRNGPGGSGTKAVLSWRGGRVKPAAAKPGAPRGRARENAAGNQQQQRPDVPSPYSGRPQTSLPARDDSGLDSFDATLEAAADCDSNWLLREGHTGSSDEEEVSSAPAWQQLPPPNSSTQQPRRAQQASEAATPTAGPACPGSPTGLVLPHLRSAGSEGTSWLVSCSPTHSTELASSPSLAISGSLCLPSSSTAPLQGSRSTWQTVAAPAAAEEASNSGSSVTLQPLPPSRQTAAAATAARDGALSPDSSPRSPTLYWRTSAAGSKWRLSGAPSSSTPRGSTQQQEGAELSPLAAALAAAGPTQAAAAAGRVTGSGRRQQQQAGGSRRRRSSPFLARDCSKVDLVYTDRYSRWTQQHDSSGSLSSSGDGGLPRAPVPLALGGRPRLEWDAAAVAAAAAERRQHFAASLEAADLGDSGSRVQAAVAAATAAGGCGGQAVARGAAAARAAAGGSSGGPARTWLRAAINSMMQWMSERLVSHPIDLTPSELDSFDSCGSSLAGTPCSSSSPASSIRFFTPGSSGGAFAACNGAAGGAYGGTGGSRLTPPRSFSRITPAAAAAAAGSGGSKLAALAAARAAVPHPLHYSGDGASSSGGSCIGSPTSAAVAAAAVGAACWSRADSGCSRASSSNRCSSRIPASPAPAAAGRGGFGGTFPPWEPVAMTSPQQQHGWQPGRGSSPAADGFEHYQTPISCSPGMLEAACLSRAAEGVQEAQHEPQQQQQQRARSLAAGFEVAAAAGMSLPRIAPTQETAALAADVGGGSTRLQADPEPQEAAGRSSSWLTAADAGAELLALEAQQQTQNVPWLQQAPQQRRRQLPGPQLAPQQRQVPGPQQAQQQRWQLD